MTRTKCQHPERGVFKLMNLWGLKEFVKSQGLRIIKSGFFDAPFWPDFAFSIEEIKNNLPFFRVANKTKDSNSGEDQVQNMAPVIAKAMEFEKRLPKVLLPIFAHHQYVLGKL